MPLLIQAEIDRLTGWVRVGSRYDPNLISYVKQFPGAKWGPKQGIPPGPWQHVPRKHASWFLPLNAWRLLAPKLQHPDMGGKFVIQVEETRERRAQIPPVIENRLRPYQIEAVHDLIQHHGKLLTFDPRVGKTPTAIATATALMGAGHADLAFIFYPGQVSGEWEAQLRAWANVSLYAFQGLAPLSDMEVSALRATPFLFVGCHYEILAARELDIARLAAERRIVVIGDEIHQCQNPKAGRTQVLQRLARGVPLLKGHETQRGMKYWTLDPESVPAAGVQVAGLYGLTGTPMRNRPINLWSVMDIIQPDSMGGYWSFAKRYCGAKEDENGYMGVFGRSNEKELRARLSNASIRKTRAEVAPWLPKSQRSVILCDGRPADMKRYRALERKLGGAAKVARAVEDVDLTPAQRSIVEQLASITLASKIPTAIERLLEHAERGVKTVGFAHFHQSLHDWYKSLDALLQHAMEKGEAVPLVFVAGGWLSLQERREVIAQWKLAQGNAILLANTLSTSVGIDLSDAEVSVFLEYEWVPADFRQAEDRIVDVHQGKRKAPPLLEYVAVKDTIDTDICTAMVGKIDAINAIVGADAETTGLAAAIKDAGLIHGDRMHLPSTDKDAVLAAILAARDRMLKGAANTDEEDADTLAAEAEDAFSDDAPATEDAELANDIPF